MLLFSLGIILLFELSRVQCVRFILVRIEGQVGFRCQYRTVFGRIVGRIEIFFRPETMFIQRGIIPQNFSLQDPVVSEYLGNKQTNRLTYCCYRGWKQLSITFCILGLYIDINRIQIPSSHDYIHEVRILNPRNVSSNLLN